MSSANNITNGNNNNESTDTMKITTADTATMMSNSVNKQSEMADVLEERLIDAEYKIWKKNTPYLYDFVMTHSLEWPSLTCQWLPTVRNTNTDAGSGVLGTNSTAVNTTAAAASGGSGDAAGGNSSSTSEYSLLLGTHTTEEQNYLMVASCYVPSSNTSEHTGGEEEQQMQQQQQPQPNNNNENEHPNASTTNNTSNKKQKTTLGGSPSSAPATTNNESSATVSLPTSAYDDEKKEIGGFGHNLSSNQGKIEIRMKIKHHGEVNRARYMPQNHFIVATRGPHPELYIWDLSKHPSVPEDNNSVVNEFNNPSDCRPQGICRGHTQEGYGLVWSKHRAGYLLSGAEDQTVCLWDVSRVTESSASSLSSPATISPITTFTGHTSVVEDVDWHHHDPNLVASVGDDRSIRLWDVREKGEKPLHTVINAHRGDVNCIAFNPVNEHVVATGSADKNIALWDIRNLKSRTHLLTGHNDQVYMVDWAPFNESILGSCSADRRVGVWDLSRIGMEQTPEDAEDGPPELLFLHGGHCSKVSDFCWNPRYEWTISSVSEDNVLQVWNMAEEIYAPEEDDDDDDDEEEEDDEEDDDDDEAEEEEDDVEILEDAKETTPKKTKDGDDDKMDVDTPDKKKDHSGELDDDDLE